MADTGWVICGTGSDDATVGSEAWNNPGNVTADDATYADGNAASVDEQMHYIIGSNFGLSVPSGATINGIEIRGQFRDASSFDVSYINYARVYHPVSGFGNDLESGGTYVTASPINYDYGSASELHGLSWSAANVNHPSFCVIFSLNAGSYFAVAGDPQCDAIWVKVHYTPATSRRNKFYIYG